MLQVNACCNLPSTIHSILFCPYHSAYRCCFRLYHSVHITLLYQCIFVIIQKCYVNINCFVRITLLIDVLFFVCITLYVSLCFINVFLLLSRNVM